MNDAEMTSFRTLKNYLFKPLILALPRSILTYVLYTDACEKELGAILMQRYAEYSLRPTGYYSRSMTATERNYHTTDRECLAIMWILLLLHLYLYGTNFQIRTNHDYL